MEAKAGLPLSCPRESKRGCVYVCTCACVCVVLAWSWGTGVPDLSHRTLCLSDYFLKSVKDDT